MSHEAGSQESTHPFLENPAHAAFRGHGLAVPGMGREKGKGHLGHSPQEQALVCQGAQAGGKGRSGFLGRRPKPPEEHGEHCPICFVCPQICWTWLRWC